MADEIENPLRDSLFRLAIAGDFERRFYLTMAEFESLSKDFGIDPYGRLDDVVERIFREDKYKRVDDRPYIQDVRNVALNTILLQVQAPYVDEVFNNRNGNANDRDIVYRKTIRPVIGMLDDIRNGGSPKKLPPWVKYPCGPLLRNHVDNVVNDKTIYHQAAEGPSDQPA